MDAMGKMRRTGKCRRDGGRLGERDYRRKRKWSGCGGKWQVVRVMARALFGDELLPFVAIAYKLVGGVVVDFRYEEADVLERSAVCPFNYVAAFFIKGGSLIPVSGLGKFLYLFERGDFANIPILRFSP